MSFDLVSALVGSALGGFAKKILGRLAEDTYDEIKSFRGRNLAAVVDQSREQVEASGRQAHEVPPRILIPILSGASLEDDIGLQERWAALLANVAIADSPDDVPPYFATILSQLTPFAARVVREMPHGATLRSVARAVMRGQYPVPGAELSQIASHLGVAADDRLKATLDLLVGNSLLERAIDMPDESNPLAMRLGPATKYNLTALGERFLAVCEPPSRSADA